MTLYNPLSPQTSNPIPLLIQSFCALRSSERAVFPVLVFHGERTVHKKETHAKRAGATGGKCEKCCLPQVLNEVRKREFAYVVAPNDSDHQLKYLESSGLVDFMLTDDTDAVVLGCAEIVHKVSWSVSTLNYNVYNRSNVTKSVDTNAVNVVVDLMGTHGDAAVHLWAVASGCGYREGKVPGRAPNGSEWHCSTHSKRRDSKYPLFCEIPRHQGSCRRECCGHANSQTSGKHGGL